jgi:gamma-glutamyltranspeptidase/glutathione hydrolase
MRSWEKMLHTCTGRRGMVTSPHHLASQAGLEILRSGGSATEATVAMAATLAVVCPHMTGIGGDGFWLVSRPGRRPVGIDAAGATGLGVTSELYRRSGLASIPWRGPLAAITVAGTVSGWKMALEIDASDNPLPLKQILRDAIDYAENGAPVSAAQAALAAQKSEELRYVFGFAETYMPAGCPLKPLSLLKQPALAATLHRLASDGLDSFYRGATGAAVAADLSRAGSPLGSGDLERHTARRREPLSVEVSGAKLFNFPPPTQGLASLMILALFDRLRVAAGEGFDHVHGLVESTKQAFLVRDREIGDPDDMTSDPADFLAAEFLDTMAARIDRAQALAWPAAPSGGDTVWLGAIDDAGRSTSMIQSLYFEFGSGIVLPETGVVWQNRGAAFNLEGGRNMLRPCRRPMHTLNPAMAHFSDGRHMVYGTMGGEGQPQTQAAIFARYAWFGMPLQQAVTAPRWLLGRTWGDPSTTLKLEDRFDERLYSSLAAAGHRVEIVEPFSNLMGHAGAIVRHSHGVLEGASDPRSDGAAVSY